MSENSPKSRSFGIAEIAGTALIVPAVLVLLALFSYQEAGAAGGGAASNLIGVGGHVSAELLQYLFGRAAFLIPPYALVVGAYCLVSGRVPDLLLRAIALFILVIASAVLIYLFDGVDETLFWSGGGVMGRRLGDAMETIVGHYGAMILAVGALVPGLMLGSPYSLAELVSAFSQGTGKGLRASGGAFWKLGAIAVGLSVAVGVLRGWKSSEKTSREQAGNNAPGADDDQAQDKDASQVTNDDLSRQALAAARDEHFKEQNRMKSNKQNQSRRASAAEQSDILEPGAESRPLFSRIHAARKPWFERVGSDAGEEPVATGKRRGELEKLSPTYGKQVALDNGFLLSTRARHVRTLLKGLADDGQQTIGGEEQPRYDERTDERLGSGDRGQRVPAPRPPRSRPAPRKSYATQAAAENSRPRQNGGDDYKGYFTDDDSRFHFRSLDLNNRRSDASVNRDSANASRNASAPAREPFRPRVSPKGEPLLRPINLKILERENQERATQARDRADDRAHRDQVAARDFEAGQTYEQQQAQQYPGPAVEQHPEPQPQARGIAPGSRTLEALQSFSEPAAQPAEVGNLALAREESNPYQTRVVDNFETDDMNLPLREELEDAREVVDESGIQAQDFLAVESAVEEALENSEVGADLDADITLRASAKMTAPAVEAPALDEVAVEEMAVDELPAPSDVTAERASEVSASEPQMEYQRPLRKEQKEAPPFPELPAVEVLRPDYYIPRDILRLPNRLPPEDIQGEVELTKQRLQKTLNDFGIKAEIVRTQRGPIITLYEIRPEAGIKVARIMNIVDEIKMNLEARSVRIIAPIPGKNTVGIEIPNRRREEVTLGELVRHDPSFFGKQRELSLAMGKDISGENGYVDLTKLPHLLIAGATGAGKSVYMNTIIASLLYTRSPHELRFIMIDPKMVELTLFEGIPHLLMPVITDVKRASKALNWAVGEMERRYAYLSHMKCRDIRSYNSKFAKGNARGAVSSDDAHMPYLVIFIDELSDLMIMAPKDVEDSIIRLTQKARAVGIHIVMATQRPSVDVITALIKANCPARIAFQVAQKTDSRVILDSNGAETLLGRGDMLYKTPSATGLGRIQTPLIEENEIERIVQETRKFGRPSYIEMPMGSESDEEFGGEADDVDRGLFDEAWKIVQETGKTSTSYIQRRLRIGYNRAARIIEMLEEKGYLGPQVGNRPREILKKD